MWCFLSIDKISRLHLIIFVWIIMCNYGFVLIELKIFILFEINFQRNLVIKNVYFCEKENPLINKCEYINGEFVK